MDELAARYGFTYEIVKADIDEKAIRHEDAQHLVRQEKLWGLPWCQQPPLWVFGNHRALL